MRDCRALIKTPAALLTALPVKLIINCLSGVIVRVVIPAKAGIQVEATWMPD